ncbi:MAG: bifunctional diaminohydroxyphosphoribosylaminopyrimidine deaminase/5-amino-6-(5-phosphoribosylamino)uracil reductase RibD [Desulfobacca sp.]|uniref:bifunctional diaminohydroxyphosphoribosylaminopyrimidine deaminase/5-amino-6-(5-phosphoribosylamino)uracil reductase RibD n=1 Tax=Desulfobacca sp. TaxID=2067990 RepID=UPI00404B9F65
MVMTERVPSWSPADRSFMARALRLAKKGAGFTSPNPMVGAVVVRDGRIVGQGYHRRYGGPHAEVEALSQAGAAARGATLYVTLEPCNHHGKTPPCTQAVLAAGIARVVIANADPNPRVTGGGAAFLRQQGLQVEMGLLAEAARRLNEPFFKASTTGRPWVIAKAAASLDGKIATHTNDSHWITGPAARLWVHRLRHQVDAILVGVGTVVADDPQLTTRLPRGRGKDPVRVILDSRLRLPLTAQVLQLHSTAPTWIACTEAAPPDKREALAALGAECLLLPSRQGRVDLEALLSLLGQRRLQSLLVEGGAEVHGAFFEAGLIDKFYLFLAPKLIGGRQAPGVFGGQGITRLAEAPSLRELTIRRLGPDLLISGYLAATFPVCADPTV